MQQVLLVDPQREAADEVGVGHDHPVGAAVGNVEVGLDGVRAADDSGDHAALNVRHAALELEPKVPSLPTDSPASSRRLNCGPGWRPPHAWWCQTGSRRKVRSLANTNSGCCSAIQCPTPGTSSMLKSSTRVSKSRSRVGVITGSAVPCSQRTGTLTRSSANSPRSHRRNSRLRNVRYQREQAIACSRSCNTLAYSRKSFSGNIYPAPTHFTTSRR